MEYASSCGFPVWINRCGVLSGEGQFGIPSQGIVSFWIAKALAGHKLTYTGQGGKGYQVRDLMHPADLTKLLILQIETPMCGFALYNVSGGMESSFSLFELTAFCHNRGLVFDIASDSTDRPNDVAHIVLDSSPVRQFLDWRPEIGRDEIFQRVFDFITEHDDWLRVSGNQLR